MNRTKPQWLSLKRIQSWNPLLAVRPMLTPMADGELGAGQPPPDPDS